MVENLDTNQLKKDTKLHYDLWIRNLVEVLNHLDCNCNWKKQKGDLEIGTKKLKNNWN